MWSLNIVNILTPISVIVRHRYHHNFNHNYGDVIMGAIASQITSLTIVCSTVYSDADQRKYQSSASLAFVRGIHRAPVNSPHKWPVTRRMFPFDDVIMTVITTVIIFVLIITKHAYHNQQLKPRIVTIPCMSALVVLECHSVSGLCEGNSPVTGEFPAQRASNAENVSIWWRHHDHFFWSRQCRQSWHHEHLFATSWCVGLVMSLCKHY